MGQGANSIHSMIEQLPQTQQEGFTSIYRKAEIKELQVYPFQGFENIYDLFKHSVQRCPNSPALGYITVQKQKDEEGKDVEIRKISSFTYKQLYQASMKLGKSLVGRELPCTEPLHGMKLMGIYAKNRYEWFLSDLACLHFGVVAVPLYDTLGIENLSYCLKLTGITSLFVGADTAKILLKLTQYGNLQNLVCYDTLDSETEKELLARKFNIIMLGDLMNEAEKWNHISNQGVKYKTDDCYTFCFTSGTTGPPKGALLSHKNLLAFFTGIRFHYDLDVSEKDVYLSYLPLPHSMERCITTGLLCCGAYIVCSSGNVQKIKEDCQIAQPTLFVSVPRLYNRITEAIKSRFNHETGIKKWIIDHGVNAKLGHLHDYGEYKSFIYDPIVFSKIKDGFGGKVRVMASGSAPLSPQVHEFMMATMSCPLIEGYGSTESSAGVLYSNSVDPVHGQFAEIACTTEIKLCDIPQMRYTSKDKNEKGELSPRGELWVRGAQVFLGYYKDEEKTKETLTEDGWLKTGDVAQIMPLSNAVKIIDRKKNIFKLQQGEYIAPDKVEQVYSKHGLLTEVFLHGDSTQNFCVLIATPHKGHFVDLAKAKGIDEPFQQLCLNPKVREFVLRQVNAFGKHHGLNGMELARNIYFQTEGFGSRNILTNTMKLIRFEAKIHYKQQIEEMYSQGDIVSSQK